MAKLPLRRSQAIKVEFSRRGWCVGDFKCKNKWRVLCAKGNDLIDEVGLTRSGTWIRAANKANVLETAPELTISHKQSVLPTLIRGQFLPQTINIEPMFVVK